MEFIRASQLEQFVEESKAILAEHGDKVVLPADLAWVEDGERVEVAVADLPVGRAARRHRPRGRGGLRRRIAAAGTVFVNGPAGVFEQPETEYGTRALWEAMADTPGFSALGGGDSVTAMNRFGLAGRFDYVCTAGGAMVQFLSGKPMPVIEALKDVGRRASADGPCGRRMRLLDPLRRRRARRSSFRTASRPTSSARAAASARRSPPPARARRPRTNRRRSGEPWRSPSARRASRSSRRRRAGPSIVVSDVTRPCPSYRFLPALLEELSPLPPEDISILFALGGHRAHTAEEQRRLVGEEVAASGVRLVDLDAARCVPVGTTSRGTRLEVFEPYLDADLRICTGNIEYHYFAGFSGGAKAVVPGLCSYAAIRDNHSMMLAPTARAGIIAGNPVREDIDEAGGADRHRLHLQRPAGRGQADHPRRGRPLPRGAPGRRRRLRRALRPAHPGGRRRGHRLARRRAQGHQPLPGAEDARQRRRRGARRRRDRAGRPLPRGLRQQGVRGVDDRDGHAAGAHRPHPAGVRARRPQGGGGRRAAGEGGRLPRLRVPGRRRAQHVHDAVRDRGRGGERRAGRDAARRRAAWSCPTAAG